MRRQPPRSTLLPYPTPFRSDPDPPAVALGDRAGHGEPDPGAVGVAGSEARERREHALPVVRRDAGTVVRDRKSTRLNSSHANISYAVFCLKKKTFEELKCFT